jgi:UDP-N-acetylmuramoylalanine--D-glutamate ligase
VSGEPVRRPGLPEGPWLVVGLARSGAAAARLLAERGEEVLGSDTGRPSEAAGIEGVEVRLGSEGLELLERARAVVKSPGVPAEAPVITAARQRGVPVVGELELAWRLIPEPFTAVTGTNGKTTTVELLGAIYRAAGEEAAVAGNVGTPLSSLVGHVAPGTTVVCEASSFQLEDSLEFAPECAVLLNLSEDHLDRHGTPDAYRAAKLRAFANQHEEHVAVLPAGWPRPGPAQVVTFGGRSGASPPASAGPADLDLTGDVLTWQGEALLPAAEVRLRGAHNLENAMAAAAAALARGLPSDAVREGLRTFPGVPHRLEEVALRDGVLYVNDSKATNVASAVRGIEAFEEGVHAILGGSLKGGGFAGLRASVAARCRAAYLVGQAAERLEADLEGAVPLHLCGDLERAVGEATAAAREGEVVLLSPACASFDQYRDFEERGDHFRRLVRG